MSDDVAAIAVRNLMALAELAGLAPDDLFAGRRISPADFVKGSPWVDWDTYCDLCERVAEQVGGWEHLDRLTDRQVEVSPAWTVALSGCVSVHALVHVIAVANPLAWRPVAFRAVTESPEVVRFELQIPERLRPNLPYVRATTGGMRACALRLDRPPNDVEELELSGHRGVWRIRPKPGRGVVRQLGRAVTLATTALLQRGTSEGVEVMSELDRIEFERSAERLAVARQSALRSGAWFVLGPQGQVVWSSGRGRALVERDAGAVARLRAGTAPTGTRIEPVPGVEALRWVVPTGGRADTGVRVTRAAEVWALTRAQSEVLAEVVFGKTNKEIAAELGIAEATVEVHVTALLRKAHAGNRASLVATFWTAVELTPGPG